MFKVKTAEQRQQHGTNVDSIGLLKHSKNYC